MGFQHMTYSERRKFGKQGGTKTRERMLEKDPEYYAKIGRKGSDALIESKGGLEKAKEHFSKIGSIGKGEK